MEDPLVGYSGLSLFPRTLASLPNPPKPYDPDDLHHSHNFLKSMPLRSPNKLLEQAKVILDSSSELLTSKIPSNVASNNKDEVVVAAKVMENPRERRPGLGRKRARFSLKPNLSQPTVSLEPTLDIAKLKDPEEFFAAFERLENAKRELQRQTGGALMELDQNTLFNVAPRPRREGILGRTVKYKHRYPISISSQDTIEEDSFSLLDESSQLETVNPNVASQERELTGSIAKKEKRVNELLDELLTGNYEELDGDGDGAVTLLQDRLQIKPIDLEKLCLPDLEDIRRIDLKASGGNSRKPRNSLSDIHKLFKGIRSSRTPLKPINAESLASPTPPLASMALLKKRMLLSNPLNDPFSVHNIDESPARNASPIESINRQSDQVDTAKELSIAKKLKSLMSEENDIAVANISSPEVAVGDFAGLSDKSVNDNSGRLGSGVDVGSSGSHADVEDNNGDRSMDLRDVYENLSRPDTDADADADVRTSGPNEWDDKVEDMLQEAVASARPDINMEDSTVENLDSVRSQLFKGIRSSRTPLKPINAENLASPTPPLASMALLKKRKLLSNPLNDPFSVHNIDQTPARNASPIESINRQSDQVDTAKELSIAKKLKSLMSEENDIAVANISSPEVAVGDFAGLSDKSVNDNSGRLGSGVDVGSSGSHADVEDNNGDRSMDLGDVYENLSRPDTDADVDVRTSGPNEWDDKVEDMLQEAVASARPDINMEDSTVENLDSVRSQLADQSSPAVTEDHAMVGRSNTPDSGSELHSEKAQESSRVPPNERSKSISRSRKEHKSTGLSRRQSLAATEDHAMDGRLDPADSGSEQHTEKAQESSRVPLNERSKAISRPRKERKSKGLSPRQSLAVTEDHAMDVQFNTADSGSEQHTEKVQESSRVPPNEQRENLAATEDHAMDGRFNTADSGSEQHTEKVQESSRVPLNEQSKAISRLCKERKSKQHSQRQSLAASGTSWESGVRRSTRIKSRPLEYWKGERFLYGRIHRSLATVIGIKYESPGKEDGKPTLKVKSFISDEYKELVELAALH